MSVIATPLRYPGGKSALTNYLRLVLRKNGLSGGHYAEPYCGGAGAAIALLRAEAVSHIHINDADPAVFAFWNAVLKRPEDLCEFVLDVPLSVAEWQVQRDVYRSASNRSWFKKACAFFYLNRVNRSGILNGGLIGGLSQEGEWLMDARFNREDLALRIRRIALRQDDISVSNLDALDFLKANSKSWPEKSLVYLGPPYYNKGQFLYRNSYGPGDHAAIACYLRRLTKRHWLASYDNAPEIRKIYAGLSQSTYSIDYSARDRSVGSEIVIFGEATLGPRVANPMKVSKDQLRRTAA